MALNLANSNVVLSLSSAYSDSSSKQALSPHFSESEDSLNLASTTCSPNKRWKKITLTKCHKCTDQEPISLCHYHYSHITQLVNTWWVGLCRTTIQACNRALKVAYHSSGNLYLTIYRVSFWGWKFSLYRQTTKKLVRNEHYGGYLMVFICGKKRKNEPSTRAFTSSHEDLVIAIILSSLSFHAL